MWLYDAKTIVYEKNVREPEKEWCFGHMYHDTDNGKDISLKEYDVSGKNLRDAKLVLAYARNTQTYETIKIHGATIVPVEGVIFPSEVFKNKNKMIEQLNNPINYVSIDIFSDCGKKKITIDRYKAMRRPEKVTTHMLYYMKIIGLETLSPIRDWQKWIIEWTILCNGDYFPGSDEDGNHQFV